MTDSDRDPNRPPEGINPDAWRIVCAGPRPTSEQLQRLSAVITRHRAARESTQAG